MKLLDRLEAIHPWQAALAAGLLAAAVALPSVWNGFVLDDTIIVQHRVLLRDPPSLGAVLGAEYWPSHWRGFLWRPLVFASYALDYRVTTSPHWFHAVNVLWAGLAAAALTFVVALMLDARLALVAGLLFAVHPVHVEATANVVGRAELMAAAGYGVALAGALLARGPSLALLGVLLGSALAIGSKEHTATLPVAIPLVMVGRAWHRGDDPRTALEDAITPAAVAALPIGLYFALRVGILDSAFGSGGEPPGLEGVGYGPRVWAMLPITLEWWRLLFFPAGLAADYSPDQLVPTTALTLAHVAAATLWLGVGWVAWRLRRSSPGVLVGLAWIVLTIVPVSNLIVPVELLVAERTLYLPSLGAMVLLATAGGRLSVSSRQQAALVGLLLVAGTARSLARVPVWRDDARFVAALSRDAPRSYLTLWLQGQRAFQAGQARTGERLLRQSIAAAPRRTPAFEDLAGVYANAGLWPPVVALMRAEMSLDSAYSGPWALLPYALLQTGDTALAARLADNGARRFPENPSVLRNALDVLAAARWCRSARWVAGRIQTSLPSQVRLDSARLAERCPKGAR